MHTRRHFLKAIIVLPLLALPFRSSASATTARAITNSKSLVLLRLAKCIAEVETGRRDTARGKVGERSQYQISEPVWRQHFPRRSFRECYGISADECALRHLTWLYDNLPYESNFWTAFAWNAGLARAKVQLTQFVIDKPAFNYAQRVINLYNDRNFQ